MTTVIPEGWIVAVTALVALTYLGRWWWTRNLTHVTQAAAWVYVALVYLVIGSGQVPAGTDMRLLLVRSAWVVMASVFLTTNILLLLFGRGRHLTPSD